MPDAETNAKFIAESDFSKVLADMEALRAKATTMQTSMEKAGQGVTTGFGGALTKAGTAMATFGKGAETVGRKMSLGLTAPIVGLGAKVTSMAVDFEESMTQIEALVGLSSSAVGEMEDRVKSLAGETARSPQELADAMFFITSAGLEGAAALETLEASAKASAVGLGSTVTVADAATSAMNAYGPANLSATDAVDVLVASIREGKLEPGELAQSLGRVIPIAAELGISFDQVGASVAAMSRLGLDANESTTALRGVMSTLLKPSAEANETLHDFGLSAAGLREQVREKGLLDVLLTLKERFGDNEEAMAQVFPNVRALAGVLNLVGENSEITQEIFDGLADSTGDLNDAFEITSETSAFDLHQSMAEIKVAMLELGEDVLPLVADLLSSVADKVKALAGWWDTLSDGQKTILLQLIGMAAAFGPILLVIGKFSSGIGGAALAIAKWVPALGAVQGPLAAVKLLISGVGKALLLNPFGLLLTAFAFLVATSPELRSVLGDLVQTLGKALAPILETVGGLVGELFDAFMPIVVLLADLAVPVFEALGWVVENVVAPALGWLADLISSTVGPVIGALGDAISWVTDLFGGGKDDAEEYGETLANEVASNAYDTSGALRDVEGSVGDLEPAMEDGADSMEDYADKMRDTMGLTEEWPESTGEAIRGLDALSESMYTTGDDSETFGDRMEGVGGTLRDRVGPDIDSVAPHAEEMADDLAGVADDVEVSFGQQLAEMIGSQVGLWATGTQKVSASADEMLENIEAQMAAEAQFANNLAILTAAGLDSIVFELANNGGPDAIAAAQALVDDMATSFEIEDRLRENVKRDITGMLDTVRGQREVAKSVFDLLGADSALGVVAGFARFKGAIQDVISSSLTEGKAGASRLLQIKSPSEVFAREIGEPAAQGIAKGIRDGFPAVEAAFRDLVSGVSRWMGGLVSAVSSAMYTVRGQFWIDFRGILSDVWGFVYSFESALRRLQSSAATAASSVRSSMSGISPYTRFSPSLIEQVKSGLAVMKVEFEQFGSDIQVESPLTADRLIDLDLVDNLVDNLIPEFPQIPVPAFSMAPLGADTVTSGDQYTYIVNNPKEKETEQSLREIVWKQSLLGVN